MSHDPTFTYSNSSNTTSPVDAPLKLISWQSAFWPVMASTLAVMFQNTGRVCGGHYRDSYALRSSPIVCVVDTLVILVKLGCMLAVGCSFRVAARHVWYDRFAEDEEVQSLNTFEMWENMMGIRRPTTGAGVLSHSQESRICMLTESCASYREEDVVCMPLEALGDPDDPLDPDTMSTTQTDTREEDNDPGPEIDLGELSLLGVGVATPISESITDSEGYHVCEAGLANDPDSIAFAEYSGAIYPGSTRDPTWTLNMAGFVFGTLPQAIKIFGMRGIPFTQAIVAFQMGSFLITELLRSIAGPAGAINLRPMPIVVNAKKGLAAIQITILLLACSSTWIFNLACFAGVTILTKSEGKQQRIIFLPLVTLTFALSVVLGFAGIYYGLSKYKSFASVTTRIERFGGSNEWLARVRHTLIVAVANLFALKPASVGRWFILGLVFPFVLAASVVLVVWLGPGWNQDVHPVVLPLGFAMSILFFPLVSLMVIYLLFRLIIMGSLSRYPRALFGLKGTNSECYTGGFIAINLFSAFVIYACLGFFPRGSKPSWADVLG